MSYKTISRKVGEKVTTAGVIFGKWKKYKMTQLPSVWSSLQDPASQCEDDHEKGGGLAQNYT